eukprot:10103192-Ditylum_brightwellii.AAC.1
MDFYRENACPGMVVCSIHGTLQPSKNQQRNIFLIIVLPILITFHQVTANKIMLLAWCYKKGSLLLTIHQIAKVHAIQVLVFVHVGTKDGKGFIDAHFTIAMRHVH